MLTISQAIPCCFNRPCRLCLTAATSSSGVQQSLCWLISLFLNATSAASKKPAMFVPQLQTNTPVLTPAVLALVLSGGVIGYTSSPEARITTSEALDEAESTVELPTDEGGEADITAEVDEPVAEDIANEDEG